MYETNPEDVYVISNVPYSRCDYFFSSEEDLLNVFSVLDEWCQKTNADVETYAKNRKYYKDIYIIIDEAHRYFDSRSSLLKGNNLEHMNNVLTQCRKRNIRIVAITQRLTMIDIRFRRLSDYVEEYKRGNFLGIYWVRHSVYENMGDLADIETDNVVRVNSDGEAESLKESSKLYSELFTPLTFGLQWFALLSKPYRTIAKEYYNTFYICALPDLKVAPLTLELLENGLLKDSYRNVKEYVNKNSLFVQTWDFIKFKCFEIWSKVKNVFPLGSKGIRVQNRQYPISYNKENVIETLFSENKKENV